MKMKMSKELNDVSINDIDFAVNEAKEIFKQIK